MRDPNFNWKKAEADIEERGGDLDRLYTRNAKSRDSYLREMDLSPSRYQKKGSGGSSSSEGCYIATCVYGDFDAPEVLILRRFRDDTLKRSLPGRAFISAYYAISPHLVRWFGTSPLFRNTWRAALDRFVAHLKKQKEN